MNDNKRKRPKSVTVYNKLLKLIVEGNYKEGDKLPGEIQLSNIVGVSRSTLRQAINLLCEDGIIERRHGVGNFVKKYDQKEWDNLEVLGNPVRKCYDGDLAQVDIQCGIVSSKEYQPYFSYIFSKPSPVIMSSERFYYNEKRLKVYVDSLISIDFLSERDLDLNSNDIILDFLDREMYLLANRIVYEWKISNENELSKDVKIESDCGSIVSVVEKVFDDKGEVIAYSKYLFPSESFKVRINFYNR